MKNFLKNSLAVISLVLVSSENEGNQFYNLIWFASAIYFIWFLCNFGKKMQEE